MPLPSSSLLSSPSASSLIVTTTPPPTLSTSTSSTATPPRPPFTVPFSFIDSILSRHLKLVMKLKSLFKKIASECCIVNAVRDGMNLVPYKYTVCRQGSSALDKALAFEDSAANLKQSMIIISNYWGCL